MAVCLEEVREFEADYYLNMPLDVAERATLRDEGITLIREARSSASNKDRGANLLAQSVHGLRWTQGLYRREFFASLYMQARGEFLLGEHDCAGEIAEEAMAHLPKVPWEFAGDIIADQYVAIASGRLSLILSATGVDSCPSTEQEDSERRLAATEAARLANITCRYSEDPSRMLFTNGDMGDIKRKAVRSRHTITARGASAGLWLPQRAVVALAETMCR